MAKTTWTMSETVQPADMNAIGTEINELRSDVDNMQVPDGTLTQKGIVQLSDVVTSTDKTKAATANSVKLAFDEATAAKQLGVRRRPSPSPEPRSACGGGRSSVPTPASCTH